MSWYQNLPVLLAQATGEEEAVASGIFDGPFGNVLVAGIVLAVLILPFVIGKFIAGAIRMPDYGWKIGLILCTLAVAAAIIPSRETKLGVELKGGVILIYEIQDLAEAAEENAADKLDSGEDGEDSPELPPDSLQRENSERVLVADLIEILKDRINPSGVKEIVIRPYGTNQVEIIIPEVETAEVEAIKKLISQAGQLHFRIVAENRRHEDVIEAAMREENRKRKYITRTEVVDGKSKETRIGMWARVGRQARISDVNITTKSGRKIKKLRPFQPKGITYDTLRDANSGDILRVPSDIQTKIGDGDNLVFETWLAEQDINDIDILMGYDEEMDIDGGQIATVNRSLGAQGQNTVAFQMKSIGAANMQALTSMWGPSATEPRGHRMGILLDDVLMTAPVLKSTISDRGQITGDFTDEEVNFLVKILRAGRLPARLTKTPISESQISALLGAVTIAKASWAIGISLIVVLIFMVVYYRAAGLVAVFALLVNLALVLAVMKALQASFTLPGMAGLVLTVGMSVDANVLIFERIREELGRGAALRMAIRNGFAKATTTIVDANVTTLITAIVLYLIGTDQIRGFAVTLILGIMMSMFTAIFCARVIFDIGERKRWIKGLGMTQLFGATGFNFIGLRKVAAVVSAVLIVTGIASTVIRGSSIFDIDFSGGTSVHLHLTEPHTADEVRQRIGKQLEKVDVDGSAVQFSVTSMVYNDETLDGRIFKVDTSMLDIDKLKETLNAEFNQEGKSEIEAYSMNFEAPKATTARAANLEPGAPPAKPTPPPTGGETPAADSSEEPAADGAETPATDGGEKPAADGSETPAADGGEKPAADGSETPAADGGEKPAADGSETPAADGGEKPAADGSETPAADGGEKPAADGSETPAADGGEKPAADGGEKPAADGGEKPAADGGEKPAAADGDEPPADGSEEPAADGDAPPADGAEEPAADGEAPAEPSTDDSSQVIARREHFVAMLAQPAEDGATPAADEPADDKPAAEEPADDKPAEDPPAEDKPAEDEPAADGEATPAADGEATPAADAAETPAGDDEGAVTAPTDEPAGGSFTGEPVGGDDTSTATTRSVSAVSFEKNIGISGKALKQAVVDAATKLELNVSDINVRPDGDAPDWTDSSDVAYENWIVNIDASPEDAQKILAQLKKDFANQPVWPSSSKIGGKVAGDTQGMAIAALLASLFGIVGYIWIRFQRVVFGLAAVVALVHDVLITLGAIAVSYWLASVFGFLLVEEFKISLPVVAAFLTIIGYSLNDTIVVFDRIREVRGKNPDLTETMINTSINQTLSRTMLTSLTTLVVVLILYFIGGEGIHAFAFALVVGVVVGTYSSIFVASPALLWMMDLSKNGSEPSAKRVKSS